jgi:hypothetical protein
MAAALTYTTLLTDVQSYAERDDQTFIDQLPRLVSQAESRIATEARGLGFMRSVTDDMKVSQQWLPKPARWRETVSIQIGSGANYATRIILFSRSYEYCRTYWPNPRDTDVPKYYADWNFNHWLIVPTPSLAYPYEVIYHERPLPLSTNSQTNWTTEFAPQLLLYATLLEAQPFLKRDDRIPVFQAEYDRALKQLEFDQQKREMDRSSTSNDG